MTPRAAFEYLNRVTGLAPLTAPQFEGDDPILPTPFRAATAAAASLGLSAAACAEIWRLRGGDKQALSVELSAAAASLSSYALLKRNGKTLPGPTGTGATTGFYPCAGGRWVHLHGGSAPQAMRLLDLLNARDTSDAVRLAVSKWNGVALEDAIGFMNLSGALVRSEEEWHDSAPGRALAKTPPIVLKKIGEAPVLRLQDSRLPLDGIRVLDLGRVLSGPVASRTLASYGADVLNVRAERIDAIAAYDLDAGHGKRSAFLDLVRPADAECLRKLVRGAHVFVDSHRPGALARLGFSPAALAHSAPGIVHVEISAFGHDGPWAGRRGWEQTVEAATGLALAQGATRKSGRRETVPEALPALVCDYLSAYLAAAGAAAALLRRMREGGSWQVQVSLAASAMWLQSLGKIEAANMPRDWEPRTGLDRYLSSCETSTGTLEFLGPVMRMAKTPAAWRCPPPEAGADEARWLGLNEEAHAA